MIKPDPIALVVCDNVYRESGGKSALVGLFTDIIASKVPIVHPRLCVYAAVTGVRPDTRFRLEIVHAESEHRVVDLQGPAPEGVNPTTICDLNFELRALRFPEYGRYYIRFWGNGHLLLQRPFEVKPPPKKKEE